jgi:hypothetical protein
MRLLLSYICGTALVLFISGCATTKYAELYVVTPGRSADVYSACDGQYLGITPLSHIFTRSSVNHEPLVFPIIIVRDEYKPVHKVVLVNKWVENKQDAVLLENRNAFSIEMLSVCGCLVK